MQSNGSTPEGSIFMLSWSVIQGGDEKLAACVIALRGKPSSVSLAESLSLSVSEERSRLSTSFRNQPRSAGVISESLSLENSGAGEAAD